jgi:hypothetical protein
VIERTGGGDPASVRALDANPPQPAVIASAEMAKAEAARWISLHSKGLVVLIAAACRYQVNNGDGCATIGRPTRFRTGGISRWALFCGSGRVRAQISGLKIHAMPVSVTAGAERYQATFAIVLPSISIESPGLSCSASTPNIGVHGCQPATCNRGSPSGSREIIT